KNLKQDDDSWDKICDKVESWSTKSTDDKEDFFKTTLPTIEFEDQFSVIDLKFYTKYEEYLDDVRREDTKNKGDAFDLLLWRRKQYEEDFEAFPRSVKHVRYPSLLGEASTRGSSVVNVRVRTVGSTFYRFRWSLLSFGHAFYLESERKT
ncbi:22654_t:CDS:2, partial [Dentiscutata erythropus]